MSIYKHSHMYACMYVLYILMLCILCMFPCFYYGRPHKHESTGISAIKCAHTQTIVNVYTRTNIWTYTDLIWFFFFWEKDRKKETNVNRYILQEIKTKNSAKVIVLLYRFILFLLPLSSHYICYTFSCPFDFDFCWFSIFHSYP